VSFKRSSSVLEASERVRLDRVRGVRMPRAFIHRRTRSASPAIPVATAAAVFANWLQRRRRRWAGARGGEGSVRARVSSSLGVRRPRRVQSVYAYHRHPYDTTTSASVGSSDRPIASLSFFTHLPLSIPY